jgi:hypothetical protein
LFDGLSVDDAVRTFYRRLRKIGVALSLHIEANRISAHTSHSLPAWVIKTLPLLHDEVRADLLRFEHGIEPTATAEQLDGGATLVRLPSRRLRGAPPDREPPLRFVPKSPRRDPGAA